MSRSVLWSSSAVEDFDNAIAFIAERSPNAARRVAAGIDRTARDLGSIPTGRPGRVGGTYEKPVHGLPYLVAYTLTEDDAVVVILRVIHSARNWPDESWPE